MAKRSLSIGIGIVLIIVLLFLHLFPVKRVIVGFEIDPPWQAEGQISETQQNTQRQAISETFGTIRSSLRLGGFGAYEVEGFKYIPFFAATVSITAYAFLLMHPLVSGVGVERAEPFHGGPYKPVRD